MISQRMPLAILSLSTTVFLTVPAKAQVPVFQIDPAVSSVRFAVKELLP